MTCKFSANVISITQACGYLVLFVFSAITLSWGNELRLPGTGLDPSWQEALVQATDQHLVFGKDIIFSYGPFHQIYTSQISENLGPLLIGRLLYGVACGAALLLLANLSTLSFGFALAGFMALCTSTSPDATFYVLPLILLLSITIKSCARVIMLQVLIYLGLIVGVFTKLSYATAVTPTILTVGFLLIYRKGTSVWFKLVIGCAFLIAPFLLWLAAEQSILTLPQYLLGSNIEIIKGYASAMAYDDTASNWQIYAYWIGSAIVLLIIAQSSYIKTRNLMLSTCIFTSTLIILWVVFKAGMVRHDGHAIISGLTLATFAIITCAYSHNVQLNSGNINILFVPLLIGLSITSQFAHPIRTNLDIWIDRLWSSSLIFARAIAMKNERLKLINSRHLIAIAIRPEVEDLSPVPMNSSADSIPWDIADITANHLNYSPRPVIQSYAAYTDILQRKNAEHFRSHSSPSYIIIQSKSIDGRMPLDMDGQSIRALSSNYKLVGHGSRGSLILHKNPGQNRYPVHQLYSRTIPLKSGLSNGNRNWTILPKNLLLGSIFSIRINSTPFRKLQTMLFKSQPIYMEIEFSSGQILSYKVLEHGTSNVPLYPFVTDNQTLEHAFLAQQFKQGQQKVNFPTDIKPTKLRIVDSQEILGINSADIIIEQPISR